MDITTQTTISFIINKLNERVRSTRISQVQKEQDIFTIFKVFDPQYGTTFQKIYENKFSPEEKTKFFAEVEKNGVHVHISTDDRICIANMISECYDNLPWLRGELKLYYDTRSMTLLYIPTN